MRQFRAIIGPLLLLLLTACSGYQAGGSTTERSSAFTSGGERPALDRLLTQGDIQVAEEHLRQFGFDPGPVDGIYTPQTKAAIRAFQARYGLSASGLLDRSTRRELLPGLDPERHF
jgi:peptidoglycan hydrolase-like protein with peptidoglycan-binding domain